MYTLEKRKLIYIMTRKMVWYHTKCLTPGQGTPLWFDPTWVIGNCELCKMDIEGQDWWNNCSYNSSQRRLFDGINLNRNYWYSN
jgi:hypothetical protein